MLGRLNWERMRLGHSQAWSNILFTVLLWQVITIALLYDLSTFLSRDYFLGTLIRYLFAFKKYFLCMNVNVEIVMWESNFRIKSFHLKTSLEEKAILYFSAQQKRKEKIVNMMVTLLGKLPSEIFKTLCRQVKIIYYVLKSWSSNLLILFWIYLFSKRNSLVSDREIQKVGEDFSRIICHELVH